MKCRAARWLWSAFALVVPVFMAALLVGPRAPADKQDEYCVANVITASPWFGLSVNCDTYTLARLAEKPERLLEPGNWRQSRPMLVIPAYILRPLFLWAEDLPEKLGISPAPEMSEYNLRFMPDLIARGFASLAGYALFNLLTLVATFAVYLWLTLGDPFGRRWRVGTASAIAVGAFGGLLIANDVVKAFGLIPHSQLYNILAPLLAVAALAKPVRSRMHAILIGIGCGLGALAYPLFLLVAGCVVIRGSAEAAVERSWRTLTPAAVVSVLTIALPAAWVAFVLWRVGSFFSDTMHYRQVIWPIDSFAAGTLIGDFTEKLGYMLSRAGHQMSAPVLAFIPIVIAFWLKRRRPVMSQADFEICLAALIVPVLVLVFNLVVGNNVSRVAYGMVAPLLVACGILARIALHQELARTARAVALACAVLTVTEFIHVAVKAGPYS